MDLPKRHVDIFKSHLLRLVLHDSVLYNILAFLKQHVPARVTLDM